MQPETPTAKLEATNDLEDERLLARITRGELEAVGTLYDRHAAVLLKIATRVVGTREDAEDVVHDAFVVIPDRAKMYRRERGSVLAWLIAITKNRAIDRCRRRVRQHRLLSSNTMCFEPHVPDAEGTASRAERRGKIERALGRLSRPHQDLLRLVFVEGLSFPQIAEQEGLCLGTIKSRSARAMKELRRACASFKALDLAS